MAAKWIFTRRANFIARLSLVASMLTLLAVAGFAYGYVRSSFYTGVGYDVTQPVAFSHAHHVSGLGMDCRHCHPTAETHAFAGMPTTQTCMNCHGQLWTHAEMLAPLRESWRTGQAVRWQRVHNLPDFVYFEHSIHVAKGVGCSTCHGRVDQMPLVHKTQTLFMQWCLDCHRNPAPHLRPPGEIYNMAWSEKDAASAPVLLDHGIKLAGLTDCSACHR